MTVNEPSNVECRKCGKSNIKIFADGSGFCLDCGEAFTDVNGYTQPMQNTSQIAPICLGEKSTLQQSPTVKTGFYRKMAAICVVVIIIIGSVGYMIMRTSDFPAIVIDPSDKEFYDEYPGLPLGSPFLRCDVLWGEFNEWINYKAIQTVQVTPTVQGIAQQFVDKYPDDLYRRVEATYMFVADNIKYRELEEYYQYPVTTLQTMEGNCAESSALLASLLYAEGLNDVAWVTTNTTTYAHAYIAVRMPTYTEASNSVEEIIRGYLDDNWIAMSPTNDLDGNHLQFRELHSNDQAHYNIQTIVKVPLFGCAFECEFEFEEADIFLGHCMNVQCGIAAFQHDGDADITFSFQMWHNDEPYSMFDIDAVWQDSLSISSYDFQLDIDDDSWDNYLTKEEILTFILVGLDAKLIVPLEV